MRKHLIQSRSKPAFTLVELLVVIGIIALLISILLPALGKARAMAQNIKCQANLHSIGLAIALYENQYQNYFPAGYTGNNAWDTHWDATLQQLLGRTGNIGFQTQNQSAGMLGQSFLCPSHLVEPTMDGTYECDYSCHPRLMPELQQDLDYGAPLVNGSPPFMHQVKVTQVPNNANIVLIMDGTQVNPIYGYNGTYVNWCAWPVCTGIDTGYMTAPPSLCIGVAGAPDLTQPVATRYIVDAISNKDSVSCIRWRHNNKANFLFVDGHVGQFTVIPRDLDSSGNDWAGIYICNLMRSNVWLPYIP